MTKFEVLSLLLTIIGVLMIPLIGMMIRGIIRWTKAEALLTQVIKQIEDLIQDKDQTHRDMIQQMKEDRTATNDRLTWLEHNLWDRKP